MLVRKESYIWQVSFSLFILILLCDLHNHTYPQLAKNLLWIVLSKTLLLSEQDKNIQFSCTVRIIFRTMFCGTILWLKTQWEKRPLWSVWANAIYGISLLQIYSGIFHIKILIIPMVKTLYIPLYTCTSSSLSIHGLLDI